MRTLGISFCLLLTLVASPLLAQSATKNAKAAIAFDIRIAKITGSDLGKSLELTDKMAMIPKGDGPDMSKIVSLTGAMTTPKDMEAVKQMQQSGDLPVDFYVRFKFSDSDGASSMLGNAKKENSGTVEKNGKTFYKAPENAGMPDGVMMYQVDSTTIEIGTEAFVFRTGAAAYTDGLTKAWKSVPDEAIRLAIDMKAAKTLIEEAVEEGNAAANGNPMVEGILELVPKMKNLNISIDVSSKNLLTLSSQGDTAEVAENLRDGLKSLMTLAVKPMGKQQAQGVKMMDPAGGAMLEKIVDGMDATAKGDVVTFAVPKPTGFNAAVKNIVEKLMMAGNPNDF